MPLGAGSEAGLVTVSQHWHAAGCINAEGKAATSQQVQVLVDEFEKLAGRWIVLAILEADFSASCMTISTR